MRDSEYEATPCGCASYCRTRSPGARDCGCGWGDLCEVGPDPDAYHVPRGWHVWASCDDDARAAAIVRRLNEEGRDATYHEADHVYHDGWLVRSHYRYHIIAETQATADRRHASL